MAYKYSDEAMELARSMYLKYNPLEDIIKASGIPRASILYYIPKWKKDRELQKIEIIEALTDSKRGLMSTIAKHGLEILARSIQGLNDSKQILEPKEMSKIADIIDSLDKITKLDSGAPTEILAEIKPATIIEIQQLMNKDPFAERIDYVEHEEIKEDSEVHSSNDDDNVSADNSKHTSDDTP